MANDAFRHPWLVELGQRVTVLEQFRTVDSSGATKPRNHCSGFERWLPSSGEQTEKPQPTQLARRIARSGDGECRGEESIDVDSPRAAGTVQPGRRGVLGDSVARRRVPMSQDDVPAKVKAIGYNPNEPTYAAMSPDYHSENQSNRACSSSTSMTLTPSLTPGAMARSVDAVMRRMNAVDARSVAKRQQRK